MHGSPSSVRGKTVIFSGASSLAILTQPSSSATSAAACSGVTWRSGSSLRLSETIVSALRCRMNLTVRSGSLLVEPSTSSVNVSLTFLTAPVGFFLPAMSLFLSVCSSAVAR